MRNEKFSKLSPPPHPLYVSTPLLLLLPSDLFLSSPCIEQYSSSSFPSSTPPGNLRAPVAISHATRTIWALGEKRSASVHSFWPFLAHVKERKGRRFGALILVLLLLLFLFFFLPFHPSTRRNEECASLSLTCSGPSAQMFSAGRLGWARGAVPRYRGHIRDVEVNLKFICSFGRELEAAAWNGCCWKMGYRRTRSADVLGICSFFSFSNA